MATCKNFKSNGGDTWTVEGELDLTNAEVKGLPQGVAVADAVGEAPTKAEFDALLDSLRGAGLIAES